MYSDNHISRINAFSLLFKIISTLLPLSCLQSSQNIKRQVLCTMNTHKGPIYEIVKSWIRRKLFTPIVIHKHEFIKSKEKEKRFRVNKNNKCLRIKKLKKTMF